jgi:hypothetical protein
LYVSPADRSTGHAAVWAGGSGPRPVRHTDGERGRERREKDGEIEREVRSA